jgi:hypothetical protein
MLMMRNREARFSRLPSANIQRSVFDRSCGHKTSFNVGDLIPVYVDEVLPADTVSITTSKVVRLQTLLTPIFDDLYLDTYWFFVPNRLVWNHWTEFCGENKTGAWTPTVTYQIPKITSPAGGWDFGTIADYMGLPVKKAITADYAPSALPFRAYGLICDEFFRDENVTQPLNIYKGDDTVTGSNGTDYVNDVVKGGAPFKVSKFHDYFTSCLPSPQRGIVQLGLDQSHVPSVPLGVSQRLPVSSPAWEHNVFGVAQNCVLFRENSPSGPLLELRKGTGNTAVFEAAGTGPTGSLMYPVNLTVEEGVQLGTINTESLRIAFATQAYLEKSARAGTRYTEVLRSHFGVVSPDASLQRPEYLGGNRIRLNVSAVANHAQSDTDFLGDLGANSVTVDVHGDFQKSFTEHGYLFCVACVRYNHTYSQGMHKMWTRRNFLDFYLPVFAQIGEQPVKTDELYFEGSSDVFGYQEAWSEYRFRPSYVTSEMRPQHTQSLAHWHLADNYSSKPTLSDGWIREDKSTVDRVLAVGSQNANQIFCDLFFKAKWTRPMPMYSVPAMIGRF